MEHGRDGRLAGDMLHMHDMHVRRFSMELGLAVATVMATRLALPVSTTQSIVDATMVVSATATTTRLTGSSSRGATRSIACDLVI